MRLLLDTHIFLWLVVGKFHLIRSEVLAALQNLENKCFLSVVSVSEIELKIKMRKITLPANWEALRKQNQCDWLDFKPAHVLLLEQLPLIHRDPPDRLLAAQALAEDLTLVTADRNLLKYPIKTVRA